MFRDFSWSRLARDMLPNPSAKMPAGLTNVATCALLTLKFINDIGGETRRYPVLVGENVS